MASRHQRPSTCASAGRVTAQLLLSFLAFSSSPAAASRFDDQAQIALSNSPILSPLIPEPPQPADHTFTLRHIYHHGTYRHPGLHRRRDIPDTDAEVWLAAEDEHAAEQIMSLKAKSKPRKIERLIDRRPQVVDPIVAESRQRGYVLASSPSAWTIDNVPGPDVTDKETVISMALVAANAYVEKPGLPDWDEVGDPFNRSADFGWETDGLRGHIWADESNSTVIIGLKGTSPAVFDGEGTTTNDKINDNLFFSCCCAQQGQWSWHQVCDCATGTYSCNNTCVKKALHEESRYYQAARELYSNVTEMYDNSNIWVVGHSLGGAAWTASSSACRCPISQTREYTGAAHFGHTADPIYVGTCNGATASCSFAGYALETSCHTGLECVYDTVADKGWRVGIGTHKIRNVINDVLRKYDEVPECKSTPECRDCANWKMYESNSTTGTTTSTTSTTSKTRTRTATCKTPGWWGCLDETTTTGTATSTSTSSTSTCKTPGFTTTSSTTTTCETPGWFGCNDKKTEATDAHLITAPPVMPTPTDNRQDVYDEI
ncbi:hypothetical protein PG994_011063 [Apiospora phragmitis]|uniref:triacylglycerol lipase n=1 Tax=Apiospora phragmitis TaxID=2905665 RepID=A0ABR1TRS4_9PEZI